MLSFLDQRTAAAELGDRSWSYGYNATGEVTRAAKTLTSTGASLEGRNYRYNFDGIGNRISIQTGGDSTATNLRTANYTPDALNQYTSISHSGFLDIYGKAPVGQNVTVNGLATTRQGTDFRREFEFNNSTAQRWETVTTNGGSLFTAKHHIPAASTNPTYDLDGNQTSDGQWTYTWDAENRLTSATRSAAALAAGAPYRAITYRYDSKSRKITRSVATTSGGSLTTEKYLYDGWNCIAEYSNSSLNTANFQLTTSRLWGLDLSGTPQGAGGVGGLLSISDMATATTHYPCYDGNGNVRKLLHATTLVTTAIYDYGPFGELVRATGPYALSNPYRFSTKPQDVDTRLYYYGYRYYDPLTGRWPSRDPVEEKGGLNLYGFVGNSGVNRTDLLGLRPPDIQLKNCTIAVYGGHGLAIPPENNGVKDPNSLEDSEVPINIQCPPCSAATVIACNANKICNVNNLIPGAPLTVGSPLELDPVEPENSFCPQFARAVEAAKEHAKTICNKTPACCKKVKIQAKLLGRAKGMCKSTVGKSGYKGWIYDCDSQTLVEGD